MSRFDCPTVYSNLYVRMRSISLDLDANLSAKTHRLANRSLSLSERVARIVGHAYLKTLLIIGSKSYFLLITRYLYPGH